MTIPVLWLDRDNTIDITLLDDNVLIDHTLVNRILLVFTSTTIDSVLNPELFDLTNIEKIIFKPRTINDLSQGEFNVRIITYDDNNLNGIIWGNEHVHVRQG